MGNMLTKLVCYDRKDRTCCDLNNIFNCSFRRKRQGLPENNYNIDLTQLEQPVIYANNYDCPDVMNVTIENPTLLSKNIVGTRV